MSTTIDNRIVEMQFDNGQFEKNVQVSLKSLEELKKGLELDKAASSLSNLEKAANNFDLSSIENAVSSLQQRFSTLGIIGMTALENITNRAVTAGTQMMKSLSIDQIAAGMKKYEAETSSIATMRYALEGGMTEQGTQKIYKTIEQLQKYADETSYSFSTMVDNMGKFVNAGVELEKAEESMEGIANWAAKSGVSAQSANFARVMYNLSQAMGQGQVKLMDWMSIENAQMATMDFKKQVLETAVAVGTLTKEGNRYYTKASKGNKKVEVTAEGMRETLQKGWFTADVLTTVLGKYADQTTEFGLEAFKAAQQARTFTDAVEATKDAVSTGWARSFRIIFGDINQATELFTNMANGMIEVVDGIQVFRNGVLQAWASANGREALIEAFTNIWHILQGIGHEVAHAFGWLEDGTVDAYGKKLAQLSEEFKGFTEKGLSFFGKREVKEEAESATETFNGITGGLEEISKWSETAEKDIKDMISKQMKPETVAKWEAAAAAVKDLNDYVNGGSVDVETYNKKLEEVNKHIEGLKKTNKLKSSKQTALTGMLKNLKAAASVEYETAEITKEVDGEVEEAEVSIEYYSTRLRPILKGMADALGIFRDVLGVTGEKVIEFGSRFRPLLGPILGLGGAVGSLVSHIRETGVVTETVRGWLTQLADSLTPLTDRIETVAGWITDLWHVVYDRDFNEESGIEKGLGFLNGPIGEKIMNIAMGIKAAGNIIVRALSATLNIMSTFVATFIMPLIGPVASAVLDFFSGLGKVLVGLDQGFAGTEAVTGAVNQIKQFFETVKDLIVSNPIFQRAKTILTSFFKIFSTNPKAAVNYLKAVGRGLLDGVKKSELYQKAAGYLDSFSKGIKATFKNSKVLKKAKVYVNSFFKAFKRDPKKAVKALGTFAKNMVLFSKPVQAMKGFAEKAKTFLGGLFPQASINKVQGRMTGLKDSFRKTWEEKGLTGVMDKVKSTIQTKLAQWGEAFQKSKVGKKLLELKANILQTWTNLMNELENNPFVQRIKAFLERLAKAYEENGIAGAITLLKETITKKFTNLKNAFLQNGIVQAAINLKNKLKEALSDFATKVKLDEKLKKFQEWIASLKKTFKEQGPITALTRLKTTLQTKFQTFTEKFNLHNVIQTLQDWIKELKESITKADVGTAFDDLKKIIIEKFKGLLPKPEEVLTKEGEEGEEGKSFAEAIKERVSAWITTLQTQIQAVIPQLTEQIKGLLSTALRVGATLVLIRALWKIGSWIKSLKYLVDKISGKNPEKQMTALSKVIISIAIAIGTLAISLAILSQIPQDQLLNAVTALMTCLTAISVLALGIKALKLEAAMKSIMQAGIGMAAIAGAIVILAIATKMLANMDWDKFLYGLGQILILLGVMVGFLWAVNKTGGNKFSANWASILAVAGAIVVLMLAVNKIANMEPDKAKQGIIGVSGLLLALGTAMLIMNKTANNGTIKSALQVISIAFAIGNLAKTVQKLGKMDEKVLRQGLVAIGILMLVFGALTKIGGTNDPKKIGSMVVAALVTVGMLLVFAETLKKVSNIPWENMLGFAGAFAIFMFTMAGALAIMSAIPVDKLMGASVGLGVAILAIGSAILLAAKLGGTVAQAIAGDMWVVGSKLADYSSMVADLNTESINTSIQVMKDFCSAALEVVGTPDLADFRTTLIGVGADLSLYSTNVSTIDVNKMNSSLTFMKDFASAAGEIIGKDYSDVAAFGKTMQQLGSNLRLYSLLTTDIDVSNSEAIRTAAGDIGSAYDSVKDVKNPGDLTEAIANIGAALALYYDNVKDITPPKEGEGPDLSNLQQIFRDLAAAMPEGDAIADISSFAVGGDNDLTNFALGLTNIGTSLKKLGEDLSGITPDSVKPVTDLVGVLTTLNNSLKTEKFSMDFLGVFHVEAEEGAGDLQQFSEDIVTLGTAVKDYSTQVKGITKDQISGSIDALDFFVDLRKKVGKGTGFSLDFLHVFSGKPEDIDAFVEDIVKLGGAVANFANNLKGENGEGLDSAQIDVAKQTIDFVAELNKKLPETGGLKQIFSGSQNLDEFASQMSTLGNGLAQFADKTAGHDFSKAQEAAGPVVALARAQNLIQGVANWTGLDQFGAMLPSLGTNLVEFQNNANGFSSETCLAIVNGLDMILNAASNWATIDNAKTGAERVKELLSILSTDRSGVFGETFGDIAGNLAGQFWTAFYDAVNDQNGSYNVTPNGMNLSPTITPVYNMGNVAGMGDTVNGQLQNTLDTTGATLNVSAVNDAVNQASASLGSKLDTANSYLHLLYNTSADIQSVNHSDLSTVNNSVLALHDALAITITLDGQVIATAVAPKVNSILGNQL